MATFTAGTSFTDGVTGDVTAAKLNALVANATPLSNFITDRTAETSIATDDLVLISDTSDSGALNKMTVANLMKAEITGTINSTAGTITTATIPTLTAGTTTGTAATFTSGTITTGVIPTLTSTTLITSGTGTAAAPAIVPTGDTNTGAFFPSADTVAISTSGTERVRVDSSGNVGIGTASPSGPLHIRGATGRYAFPATSGTTQSNGLTLRLNDASDDNAILDIGGNSTSGYWLQVTNNANLATNYPLLLNPNGGNVGIGTTSPATKLTVSGASGSGSELRIVSTTPNTGGKITLYESTSACWEINPPSGANGPLTVKDIFNNVERLRITSDGEVYIAGTTDQGAYNLQVNGTGVWGAGAYVNGSDERLKENIQDITSGLDVVEKLRPVSFQYKEEYTADRSIQSGFIAQDLLVALEGKNYLEGVVSQGPTYYNVAYQNLIPILAKAIQELKTINNSQAQTITSLESRIITLEAA